MVDCVYPNQNVIGLLKEERKYEPSGIMMLATNDPMSSVQLFAVSLRVLPVGDVSLRYAVEVTVGIGVSSDASVTVIVKLALPVFPAEFVTSQVTVFTPTGQKCNFKPPSAPGKVPLTNPEFGSVQITFELSMIPSNASVPDGG